ncbi:hypothetical protein [Kitasatospora sp. MAP5-34]|uniref:hypothetical protein n=1 Tax=Kitasatospora sp. MAP5-34 TaxID=3035102 RepID=UPI002475D21B|nr:hypothetical protein [Kitasatospora sp. MAP5-34]MDH6579934.1 hypothetical protein [Kitasatospora sp. MAP5-34]
MPRADRLSYRGWLHRGLFVVLGALLLPASLGALPQSVHTVPQARADAGGTTVQGPPVWQPGKGSNGGYGPDGSVTVSQADNLSDQVVHVSWSGFTPSTFGGATLPTYILPGDGNILYPVRVYECRGADPKVTDCYGSTLYNQNPAKGFQQAPPPAGTTTPEYPSNMKIALTHADGTGSADIEVWTAQQSQTLGCDPQHACSLVVEPEYGGDAVGIGPLVGTSGGCLDHSQDTGANGVLEAVDSIMQTVDLGNSNEDGESCAWRNHVAVPLSFAPTPTDCKVKQADFTAQGLEMANRAMQQWRAGACLGASPINVQYTSGGGEPQARARFLQGTGSDVALTAYPDTGPAPRPYVYAPLATTSLSVVFLLDDRKSGQQILHLRLDARLLAKMLTQSYVQTFIPAKSSSFASVAGNPICVFDDPEFLQLNPVDPANGPNWPSCLSVNADPAPIVVGGTTDTTRQLTSWIAADPQAEAFLQGAPDPWGMHVDTFYLRPGFAGYPVDSFIPQDSTGAENNNPIGTVHLKQLEWNPLLGGLVQVARNALQNQPTCVNPDFNVSHSHDKCTPRTIGQRALFAVMDTGQAKAYSLPEAQLENPAGSFVSPTLDSQQAAVNDMPVDPTTGTQTLPYGIAGSAFGKDAAAYPLTTVQYAMLPTQGLSTAKAGKISQFVRQVTDQGNGQVYGFQPGRLTSGFLDLTTAQQQQAQAAVQHVAFQDGALPGNQVAAAHPGSTGPAGGSGGGSGSPSGTGGTGGSGAGGTTGGAAGTSGGATGTGDGSTPGKVSPSGAATGSPLNSQQVAAGNPSPDRAGSQRLLLPALLIGGAVLLVGGPIGIVLGGTDAGSRLRVGLRGASSSVRRGLRSGLSRLRR